MSHRIDPNQVLIALFHSFIETDVCNRYAAFLMEAKEAREVVVAYRNALNSFDDGNIARRESTLPCSKGRIKEAFFGYASALIYEGSITKELGNDLIEMYRMMNGFLDGKKADEIDKQWRKIQSKEIMIWSEEAKECFDYFCFTLPNVELHKEIFDYLNECTVLNNSMPFEQLPDMHTIHTPPIPSVPSSYKGTGERR